MTTRTVRKTATKPATKTTPRKSVTKPAATAAPVKRIAKPKAVETTESVTAHAYVPDKSVSARYVARRVNGIWDADLLRAAAARGKSVLLSGPTGSGKTLLGEAFASLEERMYYSLPCDVALDTTSLFGKYVPTDTPGQFIWQDGPVTTLFRGPCGKGGECDDPKCLGPVLNISEANFMPPKIAAALYSALDSRRELMLLGHKGEVVKAHPGLLIVADMNPNYRGTMELNAAFKNRFAFKVFWDYDKGVEESLVTSPTLREIAQKIRAMVGIEINTPVATNMLMEFEDFAKDADLGLVFAVQNFVGAFDTDEQESVGKVFDVSKQNLERDYKFALGAAVEEEELDDSDFEFEIEGV